MQSQAGRLEKPENESEVPYTPKENVNPETQNVTDNQWDFMVMNRQPKKVDKLPKIHFLTEKAATCKGEFSRRRKELLESQYIPKQFEGVPVKKSQSAMAILGRDGAEQVPSGSQGELYSCILVLCSILQKIVQVLLSSHL